MPRADRCHLCMDWKLLVPASVASSPPSDFSRPLAPTCLCVPLLFSSKTWPVACWGQLVSPRAIHSCGEWLEEEEEDLEGLAGGCRQQRAAIACPQTGSQLGRGDLPRSWEKEMVVEGGLSKKRLLRGLPDVWKLFPGDKLHIAITQKYDPEAVLPPTLQTHPRKIFSGLCLQNCFIINSF